VPQSSQSAAVPAGQTSGAGVSASGSSANDAALCMALICVPTES
jgi:hypothetical protein